MNGANILRKGSGKHIAQITVICYELDIQITMIRTNVSQVPTLSRNTQGVKIITPKEGEKLIECVTIPEEEEQEE